MTVTLVFATACLMQREDGAYLLGERPAHKPIMPLFWEFPGGKIEVGESPEQALARELMEEIGVVVQPADLQPFRFLSEARVDDSGFSYHVIVLVYRAVSWQGEPVGCEGQKLLWADVAMMRTLRLLPSNVPLLASL
jgi:8-oxo-dGTP diphosphatase